MTNQNSTSNQRKANRRRKSQGAPGRGVSAGHLAKLAAAREAVVVPPINYPDDLPVSQHRQEIADAIANNQVVIVAGETGSGKTTQIPKILLELGRGRAGQIGHTQPRRIAARSVAERIAAELGTPLGEIVGYQVRFTDQSSDRTLVKVMTDGILLATLQKDPRLLAYDTIIIDEAHERSLNIDFLLGYLAKLLPTRPDLKLIITSATIDSERFAEHFSPSNLAKIGGADPIVVEVLPKLAPVVEVTGRTYPVEVRYSPLTADNSEAGAEAVVPSVEEPRRGVPPHRFAEANRMRTPPQAAQDLANGAKKKGSKTQPQDRDLMTAIVEACDELMLEGPGDILVFLSGEREIKDAAEALSGHLQERITDQNRFDAVELLPLYSRLSAAEQHRIFAPHNRRRIVLATNVAETSLTVPGVRYVVDGGLARISRYSKTTKVQRLPIEAISKASAQQRSGRAGREAPGVAIRLYSENDFERRDEYTEPEILRTSLAAVLLQMIAVGVVDSPDEVAQFPFVQAPDTKAVRDGVLLLRELGALDDGPTPLGFTKALPPGLQPMANLQSVVATPSPDLRPPGQQSATSTSARHLLISPPLDSPSPPNHLRRYGEDPGSALPLRGPQNDGNSIPSVEETRQGRLETTASRAVTDVSRETSRVRLTPVGRQLATLPIDPRLARMVIEGAKLGVGAEVVVIAAALSIQDPRERPQDERDHADQLHARFVDPSSDFLTYLNLWNYLRQQQRTLSSSAFRKLCKAEFIHYLRVREWQDLVTQIRAMAADAGLNIGHIDESQLRGDARHSDHNSATRYQGSRHAELRNAKVLDDSVQALRDPATTLRSAHSRGPRRIVPDNSVGCEDDVVGVAEIPSDKTELPSVEEPRSGVSKPREAGDRKHPAISGDNGAVVSTGVPTDIARTIDRMGVLDAGPISWRPVHGNGDLIHKALLTGMLSQLGMQETRDIKASAVTGLKGEARARALRQAAKRARNEYLGARGTRFAIYPGSPISNKPPAWLMAAELVETSRLWARQVARINPDWVESAAEHLVRRSYANPHWSSKKGAAIATEKVMLYGLPIVTDRKVLYAKIDPEAAREMFIRHALINNEWHTHHDFLKKNQEALAAIGDKVARSRRRDLMTDEDDLYQFYDKRIPAEVVSGAEFDKWWKTARRRNPKLLTLTAKALEHPEVDLTGFPDHWTQGDLTFPLSYEMTPGSESDGVTAHIPISVLARIENAGFDWLVPGLLDDLCVATIRSLPKPIRVQLVPAPDTGRLIADWLRENTPDWADMARAGSMAGTFAGAFTRAALAVRGVEIPKDAFGAEQFEKLPVHLRMQFSIEDGGKVIATSLSLPELQREYASQTQTAVQAAMHAAAASAIRPSDRTPGNVPSKPLRDPAIPVVSRRDFIAPHSRGPRKIVEDDVVGWEPTGPQDDKVDESGAPGAPQGQFYRRIPTPTTTTARLTPSTTGASANPNLTLSSCAEPGRHLEGAEGAVAGSSEGRLEQRGTVPVTAAPKWINKAGLTNWPDELVELPLSLEVDQGGVVVRGYPALVAENTSVVSRRDDAAPLSSVKTNQPPTVCIQVLSSPEAVAAQHADGVRALLLAQNRINTQRISSRWNAKQALTLAGSGYKNTETLVTDLQKAAVAALTNGQNGHPNATKIRTKEEFEAASRYIKRHLEDEVFIIVGHIVAALTASAELEKAISANANKLPLLATLADVKKQIGDLVYPGFIAKVPPERLPHLVRYLRAAVHRIEKAAANPTRDADLTWQIRELTEQYEQVKTEADRALPNLERAERLEQARWLLEELRVSFFAQQLGTIGTVSPKRFTKLLAG